MYCIEYKISCFSACTLYTLQKKTKFSIIDFLSRCDQICRKLWICSHLLMKSLIEKNFIFCAVTTHFGKGGYKWEIACFHKISTLWKLGEITVYYAVQNTKIKCHIY